VPQQRLTLTQSKAVEDCKCHNSRRGRVHRWLSGQASRNVVRRLLCGCCIMDGQTGYAGMRKNGSVVQQKCWLLLLEGLLGNQAAGHLLQLNGPLGGQGRPPVASWTAH
jgi:hypothetical protein